MPEAPFETPVGSPCNKEVGAHENRKRETVTLRPALKPFVDWTDTTSWASSPLVAVWVTVLSCVMPQVLLLQPGLGAEKQLLQPLAPVSEHKAERAGRYMEEI